MILKRLRYNENVVEWNLPPLRRKICDYSTKTNLNDITTLHMNKFAKLNNRQAHYKKSTLHSDYAVLNVIVRVQDNPR